MKPNRGILFRTISLACVLQIYLFKEKDILNNDHFDIFEVDATRRESLPFVCEGIHPDAGIKNVSVKRFLCAVPPFVTE